MNFGYLYALMTVEAFLLGAELVGSQLTHSLIILTDAYHTLFNIISIVLLIISFKISNQTSVKNTFGWARIEVLGMLVNMTFLVALTFSLLVEGIQQLVHSSHEISEPTNYYLLFIFGVYGLLCNLLYFNIVSAAIMSQTKQRADSLKPQEKIVFNAVLGLELECPSTSTSTQNAVKLVNDKLRNKPEEVSVQKMSSIIEERNLQQNVFFGMFRDLTGSVLLILCGVCIMFTNTTAAHIIDPIFGIISALLFCGTLYPNMKNTGLILLQTVPENINVSRLKVEIQREFPIILNIHDFHVWGLTASRIIATCHIILPKFSTESYEQFSQSLNDFFNRKGIILATVQPEFNEYNDSQSECLMKCSKFSKMDCDSYTCCANDKNCSALQTTDKDLNSDDSQHFEEVVITDVQTTDVETTDIRATDVGKT